MLEMVSPQALLENTGKHLGSLWTLPPAPYYLVLLSVPVAVGNVGACVLCLHAVCTPCACVVGAGARRGSQIRMELELQMLFICNAGAGN